MKSSLVERSCCLTRKKDLLPLTGLFVPQSCFFYCTDVCTLYSIKRAFRLFSYFADYAAGTKKACFMATTVSILYRRHGRAVIFVFIFSKHKNGR